MKRVKEEIRDIIDPDTLSLKKPRWNKSSSVQPATKSDQRKNLFNIRVGFEDSRIPDLVPKRYYTGCDELRSSFKGIIRRDSNRMECE